MSEGTINEAPVYPREIVKKALKYYANSIIILHNHPAGSINASPTDIQITWLIANATATMRIRF